MSDRIEVRDFREKEFYMMDDAYLNGFARLCGQSASCVYMSLCRHANKEQRSWPSIKLLGEEFRISKSTVIRAIKVLEKHRIITVLRSKGKDGKQKANIYTLNHRKIWLKLPGITTELGSPGIKNIISPGVTTELKGYTSNNHTQVETRFLNSTEWKSLKEILKNQKRSQG